MKSWRDKSSGFVEGCIYYRKAGHGAQLGVNAPMLYLLTSRHGVRLGRPRDMSEFVAREGCTVASYSYALDDSLGWWSVRHLANGYAVARPLHRRPAMKGDTYKGRDCSGMQYYLHKEAQAALQAATAHYLRQLTGCDLL